MNGPCLCGDTACPSCGPAQGHDLQFEKVVEAVCTVVNMDDLVEADDVIGVLKALGKFPRIAALLEVIASVIETGPPVVDFPLEQKDIDYINTLLDKVRPCPKHDEWPDLEIGCPSCYQEDLLETERLAAEYQAEELKYGRE